MYMVCRSINITGELWTKDILIYLFLKMLADDDRNSSEYEYYLWIKGLC